MKLYSDTELDNDIRYVKELFSHCNLSYKDIEQNFQKLNKTISGRVYFIVSQFKNLFGMNRNWI